MSAAINDRIKAIGDVHVTMFREDGSVEHIDLKNLVVDVGKAFIASRMVGNTPAPMSHMAVGTNNAAPAPGQTALSGEIARVALDSAGSAAAVVTYTATFGPGVGTGALVEAGLFNAASVGTMESRVVFPVVNKGAGDTMAVTWTITVT